MAWVPGAFEPAFISCSLSYTHTYPSFEDSIPINVWRDIHMMSGNRRHCKLTRKGELHVPTSNYFSRAQGLSTPTSLEIREPPCTCTTVGVEHDALIPHFQGLISDVLIEM
jgi:hypothetical protein